MSYPVYGVLIMISLRLRDLRHAKGKSQEDIATYLKITRASYSMLELGKRQMNYEILDCLSSYFNVSIDYLLGRIDENAVLSYEEIKIIERYRKLDGRGKENIENILALEFERVNPQKEKSNSAG